MNPESKKQLRNAVRYFRDRRKLGFFSDEHFLAARAVLSGHTEEDIRSNPRYPSQAEDWVIELLPHAASKFVSAYRDARNGRR